MTSTNSRWATTIAITLVVAACGGGEDEPSVATDAVPAGADASDTSPETTEPPQTTETTEPPTPATTEPETTEPPTPATSEPETSEPETSEPETTEPEMTEPPEVAEPAVPFPGAGAVETGRYEHALFEGLVLNTAGGLTVESNEDHLLALRSDELTSAGSQGAVFLRTVGIIPPSEVGVHQEHHPTVPEVTVDLPEDLSIWFDAIPQVTVLDAGELTVAGQSARRWTVTIDPAAGDTFNCGFAPNCIGFVVNEQGGTYVLANVDFNTIIQFDAAPDVIGWAFGPDEPGVAEAGDFLETVLAALEVV